MHLRLGLVSSTKVGQNMSHLTNAYGKAEQDNPYGGHRGDMALPLSKAARTPKARANKPRGANIVSYIDIGIEDRLDPCPELYRHVFVTQHRYCSKNGCFRSGTDTTCIVTTI